MTVPSKNRGAAAAPSARTWFEPLSRVGAAPVNVETAVPTEPQLLSLEQRELYLLRAVELERFVDGAALLRDGEAAEPPYWMHLWPGAVALAKRVLATRALGPGSRVLELGCGLGLPAVAAACRGARVVATDYKREPLRLAHESALRNGARLSLVQMDWRADPIREGSFDFCIGADVAYDRALIPSLTATTALALKPSGEAWFADSVNTYRADLTAHLQEKGFTTETEEVLEQDEGRGVWVRMIAARRGG